MARLTSLQLDALRESGNIAMGTAATTLSELLGQKVQITAPSLSYTTISAIRKNRPVPCILINVSYKEGLEGSNVFILSDRDAGTIANIMMGNDSQEVPEKLDELYLSAVSEAMNQMMGSSATAMSEMFGRKIDITPPELEYIDLKNHDTAVAEFEEEQEIIQIAFEFTVGTIISSTMLQLLPVDFAAVLVKEMLGGLDIEGDVENQEKQEAPPPPPADEGAADKEVMITEEEITLDLPANGESIQLDWLRDVAVRVTGVLGRCRMTLSKLMSMEAGSVMELDTKVNDDVEILANGKLIARGQIVLYNEQLGIKITEIIRPWQGYERKRD